MQLFETTKSNRKRAVFRLLDFILLSHLFTGRDDQFENLGDKSPSQPCFGMSRNAFETTVLACEMLTSGKKNRRLVKLPINWVCKLLGKPHAKIYLGGSKGGIGSSLAPPSSTIMSVECLTISAWLKAQHPLTSVCGKIKRATSS